MRYEVTNTISAETLHLILEQYGIFLGKNVEYLTCFHGRVAYLEGLNVTILDMFNVQGLKEELQIQIKYRPDVLLPN